MFEGCGMQCLYMIRQVKKEQSRDGGGEHLNLYCRRYIPVHSHLAFFFSSVVHKRLTKSGHKSEGVVTHQLEKL